MNKKKEMLSELSPHMMEQHVYLRRRDLRHSRTLYAGCLFTACLLLSALRVLSLDNNNDYRYRLYTQQEGLASGTLNGIQVGNRGFIWLLSNNGLSRFDGHNFKVFVPDRKDRNRIPSFVTRQLIVTGNGQMLFQTNDALCTYNETDNAFRTLIRFYEDDEIIDCLAGDDGCWVLLRNQLKYLDLADGAIRSYPFPAGFVLNTEGHWMIHHNTVWLAQDNQVIRFIGEQRGFEQVKSNPLPGKAWSADTVPVAFFRDNHDRLCYMSRQALFYWDEQESRFVPYVALSLPFRTGSRITRVLQLPEGELVAAMHVDTICFIRPSNGKVVQTQLSATEKNLLPVKVTDVTPAFGGGVWVASVNSGVFRVLAGQGVMERLFHEDANRNSIESNYVDHILEYGNVLWMSLPGLGLMKAERYKPSMEVCVPSAEGNERDRRYDNVLVVYEKDDRHLLVGTERGLLVFDRAARSFSNWTLPRGNRDALDGFPVSAIARDQGGNIWMSGPTRRELYIVPPDMSSMTSFVPETGLVRALAGAVRTLFIDSKNRLWAGTNDNLIFMIPLTGFSLQRPDQRRVKIFEGQVTASDTVIFNSVYGISEDSRGRIFASTQNGIYCYTDSLDAFKRFPAHSAARLTVLGEEVRTCLAGEGADLWVGTGGGGLCQLAADGRLLKAYSASSGNLTDNFVYSLLRDSQGNLWMGTNRGLCQFFPQREEFRTFTLKDGIQNNTFNTGAAIVTRNGELVFGGLGGINIIDPGSIPVKKDTSAMVLSEFRVNEREMPILPEMSLKYNQNDLSFEFAALSYYRTRENQYAYRLLGFQDEWTYQRNRRYVNYTNLPPGTYTFQAKGCSYTGVWSDSWITMKVHIARPYWQTTSFRLFVVLFTLGIIYLFLRFRFLHRIRMEQVRTSIAQDLHDEIGSNLSGISLFAGVARKQIGKNPAEAERMLNRISEYTQVSQDAINDIVWMINVRNDRFDKIEIRMRKLAAEILESRQISFSLQFDEELERVKLPMFARKNFYLIFKEALNNIVKYAECSHVDIRLTGQHGHIRLVIRDDGKGFDTGRASDGNGLINMKKRAATLEGNLVIQSAPGKGTSVELDFIALNAS